MAMTHTNVHSTKLKGCVPDQHGTDISRWKTGVIHDVGKSVHGYLYSSGGRKLGILRMATTFYLKSLPFWGGGMCRRKMEFTATFS